MKKWIILDRDGTLIKEKDYLHDPDGAELTEGAAEGLRMLSKLGYRFVVLTNQSGIGRGYFTEDEMNAVHLRVDEMLACAGVRVEGWFASRDGSTVRISLRTAARAASPPRGSPSRRSGSSASTLRT